MPVRTYFCRRAYSSAATIAADPIPAAVPIHSVLLPEEGGGLFPAGFAGASLGEAASPAAIFLSSVIVGRLWAIEKRKERAVETGR